MSIWESFTCWYERRNKLGPGIKLSTLPDKQQDKEPDFTIKRLHCSGCYKYLDNENEYIKKAIIGHNLFGFCHEECYDEWLKNPQYKFLGKIN
tara:strand:- start:234 stop:512 length:279 start_codon:yes stop_codon:yes gene_type:complete